MIDLSNEEKTAQQVASHMMDTDQVAKALGINLDDIKPGFAKMSLQITGKMLNGLGIGHGGVTYTLADTAFAFSCNSRNKRTVALNCSIHYCAKVEQGDELCATAVERSLTGRTGIYDVTVTNQKGITIAHFRGTSYATSDPVIEQL